MISTDISITLASWALDLEKQRASINALNIATANTDGIKRTGNFDALINNMSHAVSAKDSLTINQLVTTKAYINENSGTEPIALDDEVIALSQANGRYKTIAEALSKKYGLMSLAMRGK